MNNGGFILYCISCKVRNANITGISDEQWEWCILPIEWAPSREALNRNEAHWASRGTTFYDVSESSESRTLIGSFENGDKCRFRLHGKSPGRGAQGSLPFSLVIWGTIIVPQCALYILQTLCNADIRWPNLGTRYSHQRVLRTSCQRSWTHSLFKF